MQKKIKVAEKTKELRETKLPIPELLEEVQLEEYYLQAEKNNVKGGIRLEKENIAESADIDSKNKKSG